MKKTCFVCYGVDGKGDELVYGEIPRKTRGEEFFVFFSPSNPDYADLSRKLFRNVISTSRLGHPLQFFQKIMGLFREHMDLYSFHDEILSDSMILILIRREKEIFLMRSRSIEPVHWNAVTGIEGLEERIPDSSEVSLRQHKEQGELFAVSVEDYFILEKFSLHEGSHTVLFVPSREFVERHREAFLDSVFFPSFEIPEDEGIEIDTCLTFPSMHWNIPDSMERATQTQKRGKGMTRKWMPYATGAAAALIAIFIIFNPFEKEGEEPGASGDQALLSAEDGIVSPENERGDGAVLQDEEPSSRKAVETGRQHGADRITAAFEEGWKKKFPAPVTSSPAIMEDMVVFGCRDGKMYSFSRDGKLLWQYESGQGIGASPACVKGRVVGADYGGRVFCLDSSTGNLLWNLETGAKVVSSPRIEGDMVVSGNMEGTLTAIGLENGKKLWSQKIGAGIWATPTIGADYIIAATTDGSLVRMDHSGKVVWRMSPGGSIYSSPLCIENENLVVFGSGDKYIYGYSLKDGSLMWRFAGGSDIQGASTTDGTNIFVGSEDGVVYALSMQGQLAWRTDMGGAVRSKPLVLGEILLVTTYGSRLSALSTLTGELVIEYKVESPVYSSPASDGERVFFGSLQGFFHAPVIRVSRG